MSVGAIASEVVVPHIIVPEAWALDMDRTLVGVQPAVDRLIMAAGHFGVSGEVIRSAQKEVEADGGSFDPLQFVEQTLDNNTFGKFGELFFEQPGTIKYDDTDEFLDGLAASPPLPTVIPTYGKNALWQGMKARLLGRPVYVEIMPDSNKGRRIASWRGPDGTYDFIASDDQGEDIAIYRTHSVVLVDDKAVSHAELPRDARGIYIKRPGKQLKSQGGGIPEDVQDRVQTVSGLDKINITKAGLGNAALHIPVAHSFRPAYAGGNAFPGILITPDTSFGELRESLSQKTRV